MRRPSGQPYRARARHPPPTTFHISHTQLTTSASTLRLPSHSAPLRAVNYLLPYYTTTGTAVSLFRFATAGIDTFNAVLDWFPAFLPAPLGRGRACCTLPSPPLSYMPLTPVSNIWGRDTYGAGFPVRRAITPEDMSWALTGDAHRRASTFVTARLIRHRRYRLVCQSFSYSVFLVDDNRDLRRFAFNMLASPPVPD